MSAPVSPKAPKSAWRPITTNSPRLMPWPPAWRCCDERPLRRPASRANRLERRGAPAGHHRHPAQHRRRGSGEDVAPAGARRSLEAGLQPPDPRATHGRAGAALGAAHCRFPPARDELRCLGGQERRPAAGRGRRDLRRGRATRPRLPSAGRGIAAQDHGAVVGVGPRGRGGRAGRRRDAQGGDPRPAGTRHRLGHDGPPAVEARLALPALLLGSNRRHGHARSAQRAHAMSRVFFHVQHLLGIGHIRRAAVLARTLAASGFDVLLVSGGAPLKLDLGRARFHQLPPVRARDEGLRELSRLDGAPLDESFKSGRVRALLELFGAEQPDVLITEQFPFGRTQLRFELLPLLQAARERKPKPLIVSSVRDVVRRSVSPQRVQETLELLQAFDTILIHGDPKVIGFERSFAAWDAIRDRAAYTGYVADLARADGAAGRDEVIVSVGGGAVGAPLIEAAAAARAKTALAARTWRLLGGAGES